MVDHSRLAIHQITFGEELPFRECVEVLARNGVTRTAVWRPKLQAVGVEDGARILRDCGMEVTGLAPAGLATSPDPAAWRAAVDDNRRALDEAAAIDADHLVTISGGLEQGSKDLEGARNRMLEALGRLVPEARRTGVRIGIEPLHPMMCAGRAVLCTLRQAIDWCDELDADDAVGLVVDTYSVWWDPNVARDIRRAGARICAFHVNDWLLDTRDLRLDRGMPGDGVIDIRNLRRLVDGAGYTGPCEVEVFSARDWWQRNPGEVVRIVQQRFPKYV